MRFPTRKVVLALLLFAAVLGAYGPSLRGGFLWDDDRYVAQNAALTAPGGLASLWTVGTTPQYYPLTFSSFWLERRLWGLDPLGYRLVNAALHALNAVLFGLILEGLACPGPWLAAALFGLHPVQVETVAWITERKNLLSAFFCLLAALSWLKFEDEEDGLWYAAALLLFTLALLSKTVACTLPAALVLARWLKGREVDARTLARLSPFLALGLGFGLLTAWVEVRHEGAFGPDYELPFLSRLLLASRALWFYLGKLAWPLRLSFVYERWAISARDPSAWAWPGAWAAAAACAWRFRRRIPRGAVAAAAYFAATLFPAVGFFKIYPQRYSYVADHFQYAASLGPLAAAGALPLWTAAPALAVCWAATWRRAHAFADEERLWRDTLAKNPSAVIAHVNLGKILQDRGLRDEAMAHYQEALRLKPGAAEAHINMGNAWLAQRRPDLAEEQFRAALSGDGDSRTDQAARRNLGAALVFEGRLNEAARTYRDQVALAPADPAALNNLCAVLNTQGRPREALPYCRRALEAAPACAQCRATLGQVLKALGPSPSPAD